MRKRRLNRTSVRYHTGLAIVLLRKMQEDPSLISYGRLRFAAIAVYQNEGTTAARDLLTYAERHGLRRKIKQLLSKAVSEVEQAISGAEWLQKNRKPMAHNHRMAIQSQAKSGKSRMVDAGECVSVRFIWVTEQSSLPKFILQGRSIFRQIVSKAGYARYESCGRYLIFCQ